MRILLIRRKADSWEADGPRGKASPPRPVLPCNTWFPLRPQTALARTISSTGGEPRPSGISSGRGGRISLVIWIPGSGRGASGSVSEQSSAQDKYQRGQSQLPHRTGFAGMPKAIALPFRPFLCLLLASCGLTIPPVKPDPALLRCFRLTTNLPASYSDSLGYERPSVIRLTHTAYDQWIVFPTDPEWHPSWTVYDGLPSSHIRIAKGLKTAPVRQWDSIRRIPGDSIDISFPSAMGRLVLRLGPDNGVLHGRAEWVIHSHISFMNDGVSVVAEPSSCRDLGPALTRTRYH